ncbi:MAG: hypothetical protein LBH98_08675 [Chitinispirillales bacterium]|jgi:hypothetical protein|nr:hypothetical protein [Chitinispirillales bacterium]
MGKKSPRETTMRGLALLAVLIVLCLFLSKIDMLIGYAEAIFSADSFSSSDNAAMTATDSLRNEYYNLIAGFWEHSSDNLYDRIELKDNGIIWQYTEKTFAFPYNLSKKITRVSTSFLSPMRFGANNYAMSNLRIIRETWFMPDTCYGKNFYDVVANTYFSNDTLIFDSIPYTRYTGGLQEFFPYGALALVDDIRVRSCNKLNPLADWLRENLAYSFDGREIPFDALKFEQELLLKKYYIPYCLSRIESAMMFEQAYNLDLKVIISPNGSVEDCIVKGKDFISAPSKKSIVNEVKKWKFPSDGQNSDTIAFKGKFIKKQ